MRLRRGRRARAWTRGCWLPAIWAALVPAGASAAASRTGRTAVAILMESGSGATELRERLLLDQSTIVTSALERARVIWIVGDVGAAPRTRAIAAARAGASLVVVPGRSRPDWSALGFSAIPGEDGRAALQADPAAPAFLREQVVWASAPQAGRRWHPRPVRAHGHDMVYLSVKEAGRARPVLLRRQFGAGRLYVFGLSLTDASNRELLLWPYFNYLLHGLTVDARHAEPTSFASWPSSPVPHRSSWPWLVLLLGLAWVVTLALFQRARRYSRRHPEVPEQFLARKANEDATQVKASAPRAWAHAGFARPLAGFLTLSAILLLLFVPFYWLTNVLLPNHVQPFPQAKGIWDFAWEALQLAWFLFDAGTFVAFVKYFAQFRQSDPAKAVRSAQFFIWWQILTGLVQVSAACAVAVFILPKTSYGYASNLVILVALGQYPGFFGAITFFFQAYQRFDYHLALDLLSDWVLRFALQIPCVLLFRAWGRAHPQYGEAFGAAIGIGVGFYLASIGSFLLGLVLYRRLGLRLLPLFCVHFDWQTAKRMLSYGLRVVAGQAFFRSAKTIERVVISLILINYPEWLGIESQIHYNLMFLFPVAYRFFETGVASISEAHGNGKLVLTEYYLVRFLQLGGLYAAVAVSLMASLGPTFVRQVMDPQWARAADYLLLAALAGIFMPPAWLSDTLQKGAGRPGLMALIIGVEQLLRIGLFYLLIPRLQFTGFYLALLVTIAIKVSAAWLINHLVIVRVRVYLWQMAVAPLVAGLLNFAVWRVLLVVVRPVGSSANLAFFFCASLASFFVCMFGYGLLGGFDRHLAAELDEASRMTGPLSPLSRLFYLTARAGWRLSPLHDRFPVTIHDQALAEAKALSASPKSAA